MSAEQAPNSTRPTATEQNSNSSKWLLQSVKSRRGAVIILLTVFMLTDSLDTICEIARPQLTLPQGNSIREDGRLAVPKSRNRRELGTKEDIPARGIEVKTAEDVVTAGAQLEKQMNQIEERHLRVSYQTLNLICQSLNYLLSTTRVRLTTSQTSTYQMTSLMKRIRKTEIATQKLARRLRVSSESMGWTCTFVPDLPVSVPVWLREIDEILDAVANTAVDEDIKRGK